MLTLTKEDQLDFLRKQVLTSRNVLGRPWVDFALELNFQIEHHPFPFCVSRGISWQRTATN